VDVILITSGIKPNPYFKNVIFKKSTPQVLSQDGDYRGPGQEQVAILLLGAKSNHPMGIFSPDYRTVDNFLTDMSAELEDPMSQDAGCKCFFPVTIFDSEGMLTNKPSSPWTNAIHSQGPKWCYRKHAYLLLAIN
jgi:hypothetical protein